MEKIKIFLIIFLFSLSSVESQSSAPAEEGTEKELIDRIELNLISKIMKEYVPRKNFCPRAGPSTGNNNNATRVSANVFMKDIRVEYVNKGLSYWTVDLILRQKWNNPRLAYNTADYPKFDYVSINSIRMVWVPDLFFPDEVKRDLGGYTVSSFGSVSGTSVLLWIYPNGDVLYSYRIPSLTLRCRHPTGGVSKLTCPLVIGSFGCTTERLVLDWEKINPVEVDEGLYIPFYIFANNKTVTRTKEEVTRVGNFSRIVAELQFNRND